MPKKLRQKRIIRRKVEVSGRTNRQDSFIKLIEDKDITICNGPAGSGKTLLAVGMAIKLLSESPDKYERIIMVRPAVAVRDEDLGYLPGDIDEKMRPFIMPIFDAMQFYLSKMEADEVIDSGAVEVCPISFMRGRNFHNCVIIFDEAQNSTIDQMKMVVTRIGINSKMIIEGDVTQSDIADENGLQDVIYRFRDIEEIGIIELEHSDVVRSPIVSKIIRTY